jgi:hypothetical protein
MEKVLENCRDFKNNSLYFDDNIYNNDKNEDLIPLIVANHFNVSSYLTSLFKFKVYRLSPVN